MNSIIVSKAHGKEKGGSLLASPFLLLASCVTQEGRSYFAATGMICAGGSADALFIPVPAPCNGSSR